MPSGKFLGGGGETVAPSAPFVDSKDIISSLEKALERIRQLELRQGPKMVLVEGNVTAGVDELFSVPHNLGVTPDAVFGSVRGNGYLWNDVYDGRLWDEKRIFIRSSIECPYLTLLVVKK